MAKNSEIVLVLDGIRSAYNVGAIIRTASGLGIQQLILVGDTPRPTMVDDHRLPHVRRKDAAKIEKTALGTVKEMPIKWFKQPTQTIKHLKQEDVTIWSLENQPDALPLPSISNLPSRVALVIGHERRGVSEDFLTASNLVVAIPMHHRRSSFNVAAATAMALYHMRKIIK